MEKRALLAVVLSLLILLVYQEVILPRLYTPPPQGIQAPEAYPAAPTGPDALAAPHQETTTSPSAPVPVDARSITVTTDVYTAIFSTAGARLISFRPHDYRETVAPDSPAQELITPHGNNEWPLGIELRGAAVLSDRAMAYHSDSPDQITLGPGESRTIEFTWRGEHGVVRKQVTFTAGQPDFLIAITTENIPSTYQEVALAWHHPIPSVPLTDSSVLFDRVVFLEGRKLREEQYDDLSDGKVLDSTPIRWAGYTGRHFIAALTPEDSSRHRLWLKKRGQILEQKFLFPLTNGGGHHPVDVYIGPRDIDTLELAAHDLHRAVDAGWFAIVTIPLLRALKFFHGFTGNYGIDIILLTVIIKLLFLPLTQKSFTSMQAMQKLQPQMTQIREQYKDEPEKMQKEIMEMYRRHKVNPLGGCLPMLLQIPVFIGLYQALMNAVELRHAPFVSWINDLSAPDRLGDIALPFIEPAGIPVLTLLMGASMLGQQWMTPKMGDPAQQRVMMLMPIVFTFMFVNFPSGLSLYWFVNNVLTMAQQFYINRNQN